MNADEAMRTVPLPAPVADGERETLPLPGDADTTTPPDAPTTIGRFVVTGWLGAGAFGDVYRARDPQLDREVAVKVAKPGSLNTPERLARFLREAKAAANLRHPHIVPLYETGSDGDRRFIVSAFIDGMTLESLLANPDREGGGAGLPFQRVADLGRKLADALAYAHSQGVVHRDVKPANVLVDAAGEPHLLDFGLAARQEEGAERLTQDGQGMGTPAYMAPEQADGNGVAASDQYSLGCTLYELATGQTPFAGGPVQQMFLHRTEPVPSSRSVRPDIPKDLDTLILKCLEKEPTARYANCFDLADDLRRFAAGEPVTARRIGPVERIARWTRRNPVVALSLTAAVLALVIGTAVSLWQAGVAGQRATDLGVALGDKTAALGEKTKAEADAQQKANDLKLQLTESERRVDLSRLREAQADFERNAVHSARDKLDAIPPENRCIAWRLLNRRLSADLPLWGHTRQVSCVVWSPDGRRVATGSQDGTARVWDAATGQSVLELKGHTGSVFSVAWSPDGRRVLTGSQDTTARVWDAATGQSLLHLKGHTNSGLSVAWSPDGRRVITTGGDSVRMWDATTGQSLLELKRLGGSGLAVSPDGQRVVTGGGDKTARVWDAATGPSVLELKHPDGVMVVTVSPDGRQVVTGSRDNTARVWDAATEQGVVELKGHAGNVTSVGFSPDGRRVVTGSWDNTARVWDAATGKSLVELKGHANQVSCVAWSPDGRRVVTGGFDSSSRVWDAATGQCLLELKLLGKVSSVAFSPDGRRVVTGSVGTSQVWNAVTGEQLPGNPTPETTNSGPVLSDGRLVVLVGERPVIISPPTVEELARRKWAAQPRPEVHAKLAEESKADSFAAGVQRSLEQRARGQLAVEALDFQQAFGHFLVAEILRPKPEPVTSMPKDDGKPH